MLPPGFQEWSITTMTGVFEIGSGLLALLRTARSNNLVRVRPNVNPVL
jgi:hypothetical protein